MSALQLVIVVNKGFANRGKRLLAAIFGNPSLSRFRWETKNDDAETRIVLT